MLDFHSFRVWYWISILGAFGKGFCPGGEAIWGSCPRTKYDIAFHDHQKNWKWVVFYVSHAMFYTSTDYNCDAITSSMQHISFDGM